MKTEFGRKLSKLRSVSEYRMREMATTTRTILISFKQALSTYGKNKIRLKALAGDYARKMSTFIVQ